MLHVRFAHLLPGKEARMREWLSELGRRRDEVVETLVQEGARHEQAFIIDGREGPLLVYAMESADPVAASQAYRASTLKIDQEHRAVLLECLGERLQAAPLFDCSVPPSRPA